MRGKRLTDVQAGPSAAPSLITACHPAPRIPPSGSARPGPGLNHQDCMQLPSHCSRQPWDMVFSSSVLSYRAPSHSVRACAASSWPRHHQHWGDCSRENRRRPAFLSFKLVCIPLLASRTTRASRFRVCDPLRFGLHANAARKRRAKGGSPLK